MPMFCWDIGRAATVVLRSAAGDDVVVGDRRAVKRIRTAGLLLKKPMANRSHRSRWFEIVQPMLVAAIEDEDAFEIDRRRDRRALTRAELEGKPMNRDVVRGCPEWSACNRRRRRIG